MGKPKTFTEEQVLRLFQYQGIITKEQAAQFLYQDKNPSATMIANVFRTLQILCTGNDTRSNLIWRKEIFRPWIADTGHPAAVFGLEKEGAKTLNKLTGEDQHGIKSNSATKSLQHSLALVDIAISLMDRTVMCKCNRQVTINTDQVFEDEHDDDNTIVENADEKDEDNRSVEKKEEQKTKAKKPFIKPDVQVSFQETPNTIQFIEYEQERDQEEIDKIILRRMRKWVALFNSLDGSTYKKEILLLFWHGKDKTLKPIINNTNLFVWNRALHNLIQENGGEVPPFQIYYREFKDFLENPTTDIKDYTLLLPSSKPEDEHEKLVREAYIRSAAAQCFIDPHEKETASSIKAYAAQKRELFASMENNTTRQKYFFETAMLMHEESKTNSSLTGFALASLPWTSIGIVRYWLSLPENRHLRLALIKSIASVQSSYGKGLFNAQDAIERMVWNSLFRYFGFGKGGYLSFFTIQSDGETDRNKNGGVTPIVTIKSPWPGIFKEKGDEIPTVEAITWLISLLINYYPELGLLKDNSPDFYTEELSTELSKEGQDPSS